MYSGDMDHVEQALRPVIDILRADGGDLRLVSTTGSLVELQLELKDASCAECVMPRHFLERVVQDKLEARTPWITEVLIHDPREDS